MTIFIAITNQTWVRHTVPCGVCKRWAELYRSQGASPLHVELGVNSFGNEVESTTAREGEEDSPYPVVHASRVISWAETRAGSLRKLILNGIFPHRPGVCRRDGVARDPRSLREQSSYLHHARLPDRVLPAPA